LIRKLMFRLFARLVRIEPMTEPTSRQIAVADLSREPMLRTFQTQLRALPFAQDLFF